MEQHLVGDLESPLVFLQFVEERSILQLDLNKCVIEPCSSKLVISYFDVFETYGKVICKLYATERLPPTTILLEGKTKR